MSSGSKSSPNVEALNAKAGQAALAAGGLPSAEGVSVDKIRDLLFGSQMQDYDRRFGGLEERFQQRIKEVENEATRTYTGLEAATKKQLESLASQLREEKEVRSDAEKQIERGLREQVQGLEKRVGQLSEHLAQVERDFADRLAQESQTLRDEIRRRNDELRNTIERMFGELSNVKTDRNLLAGLFVEIAKCLNQDLSPKSVGRTELAA